jgi:hypothetical protein
MGGPFPKTVSGVPASNALSVAAALERVGKLMSYANMQVHAKEMGRVPCDELFRELSALETLREPFESKIASFKRLDDLCEAWVSPNGKIAASFDLWVPLASSTYTKLAKVKDHFTHHASTVQKDAVEAALYAAMQRLSIEEEAARAVVLDKRSACTLKISHRVASLA